ncbi:uroporphyrinogen-III C-methyltransferase [Sphingomonas sp. CJ99]
MHCTSAQSPEPRAPGQVILVGAGPGDPDLLTVAAYRAICEARIVVHDGLVGPDIMALIPADARRISVAKQRSRHALPQEGINDLLVTLARTGQDVVRLKGGDPFIFGRGGEEVEAVRAAGIDVRVIPGISAAIGGAAGTLLPLTHRDHSSAVTFVAGQCRGLSDQNWSGLAGKGRTLVIYMGVATAGEITEKLIADGVSPAIAVAVIERATRPDQRVLRTLLTDLGDMIVREGVASPAIIVVGEVAALAQATDSLDQLAAKAEAMA